MARLCHRRSAYALVGSVVLLGMGALTSSAQAQWRGADRVDRCAPAPQICEAPRYTVTRVDHRSGSRRHESRRYGSRRYVRECAPVVVQRCEPVVVQRCEPVVVQRCEPVVVERCEPVRREYRRFPVSGVSLSAFFRF